MATAPAAAAGEATWNALGTAIVEAIKGVVGKDWAAIQQGTSAAAKALASVALDMADPGNTMTPDEKLEVMEDYKDSLRNALLYGEVVSKVVIKQAIDAAVQAIATALPALVGIA